MSKTNRAVPDMRVPAVFAQTYLTIAQQRGIESESLIRQAGLPADILKWPSGDVPLIVMKALVEGILERSGDQGLGLEMGFQLPPTAFGNLGSAMLCCRTLRDVIVLCFRFQQLFGRGLNASVVLEGPVGIIDLALALPMPEPFRHITYEITLAGFLRGIQLLTHATPDQMEVWFTWPRPDYPAAVLARLGRVRFNMPANQLRFSPELLDRPLPLHNPNALKFAIDQCEREVSLVDKGHADLLLKVKECLQFSERGYPTVHEIAKRLHMSTRTLRRQLESEGTNFKTLLEDAKRRDAMVLLENPAIDIQQVATLLGYEEPANFTRAFKNWTGTTPSQYRTHQYQPSP